MFLKGGLGTFGEFKFIEGRACVRLFNRFGQGAGLRVTQQLGRGVQFLRIDGSILRLGLERRLKVSELLGIDTTDARDGTDTACGTGLHALGLANSLRRRRGHRLGALAPLAGGCGGLLDRFTTLPGGCGGLLNGFATLAGGCGGLLDRLTALPSGLGGLLDGFTALASGLGSLFDRFTALPCGCGSLFDGFATLAGSRGCLFHWLTILPHRLGGLLNGLTLLWRRLNGLSDGLGLLRYRLGRFGLRGSNGLYAGRATLFDALDTFDVRGGGLLGRSGGAKETSGEE